MMDKQTMLCSEGNSTAKIKHLNVTSQIFQFVGMSFQSYAYEKGWGIDPPKSPPGYAGEHDKANINFNSAIIDKLYCLTPSHLTNNMVGLASSVGTIRIEPEPRWCDKLMDAALQHLGVFLHLGLVTGLNCKLRVLEGQNTKSGEHLTSAYKFC